MEKELDYLGIKSQSKVTSEFDSDEHVVFSADVKKVNDYGKSQGRSILVTNKRVYNLAGKKIKRAIKISDINAMTKNNVQKHLEFIIHVSSESDYRFKIETLKMRDEVFSVIKQHYAKICKKNLPVYGVTNSDLKDYHTVKSDVKKGICRVPAESYRIKSEDVLTDEGDFGGYSNGSEETKVTGLGRKSRGTIYSAKKGEEVCLDDFICK
jgi:hypothetical protein